MDLWNATVRTLENFFYLLSDIWLKGNVSNNPFIVFMKYRLKKEILPSRWTPVEIKLQLYYKVKL